MEDELIATFKKLNESIVPLANQWKDAISVLCNLLSQDSFRQNPKRRAILKEYYKYLEIHKIIQEVVRCNPQDNIENNAAIIYRVRSKLYNNVHFDNIGNDILFRIDAMKHERDKTRLHNQIKECIQLTKAAYDVIPHSTRKQIIEKLNELIRKNGDKNGIIIQLMKDTDFTHCIGLSYQVKCKKCGHVYSGSGDSDCDIFAPAQCSKCKSTYLYQVFDSKEHIKKNILQYFSCIV